MATTTMELAFKSIENLIQDAQDNNLTLQWLKDKITIDLKDDFLEIEKKQIKDSFNAGYRNGEEDANTKNNHKDISEFANADYYYNDTFEIGKK